MHSEDGDRRPTVEVGPLGETTDGSGPVTVTAGGRLHAGFLNLSLDRRRLYGGVGVALSAPAVSVTAEPADGVRPGPDESLVGEYAARVCDVLDLPGAHLTVHERLPRHVGLGSGTATALATLTAVALAHGREPGVREHAPALGRGGRSGVGVAAFRRGGLLVDAGHPTGRFTAERPPDGSWEVPAVMARRELPDDWRVLLVVPDADTGRSGDGEEAAMRAVVENAEADVADELAGLVVRRLLPAATEGRLSAFGRALAAFGRHNGAWYTDVQGGVYRPPAGQLVAALDDAPVDGVGQSSWGPAVYGVTDVERADAAREAGREALAEADVAGRVAVVAPRNTGARVVRGERPGRGFEAEPGTDI